MKSVEIICCLFIVIFTLAVAHPLPDNVLEQVDANEWWRTYGTRGSPAYPHNPDLTNSLPRGEAPPGSPMRISAAMHMAAGQQGQDTALVPRHVQMMLWGASGGRGHHGAARLLGRSVDPTAPSLLLMDPSRPALLFKDPTAPALAPTDLLRPAHLLKDPTPPALALEEASRPALLLKDPTAPALALEEASRPALLLKDPTAPALALKDPTAPSYLQKFPAVDFVPLDMSQDDLQEQQDPEPIMFSEEVLEALYTPQESELQTE